MNDPQHASAPARLRLGPAQAGKRIHRNVYGHFAEHLGRCIYDGLWVGERSSIANTRGIRNDVASALRTLGVPVLRWPGGCFADEYHWRDGIGPRHERPKTINTHWGGVVEDNQFGTHEFMDLCEQIGAEPYVCGNVGSGTPRELMQWIEYMTSDADSTLANLRRRNGRDDPWKLRYLGVGNESWGCGGNMTAEYYADNYKRYATFCKRLSDNPLERVACGASGFDFDWTDVLMSRAAEHMESLSLHFYTRVTRGWPRGSATEFGEEQWHAILLQALRMGELLDRHAAIMDRHDPERRVGLLVDEWGTWYDAEPGTNPAFLYQQNGLRDALVAAIHFNLFAQHCDRVRMANLAQTVNVLQALVLTRGDAMLLTPTYHAFDLYRVHRDATPLELELAAPEYRLGGVGLPMLHASASLADDGRRHLSIVNLDPQRMADLEVTGVPPEVKTVTARVLTATSMTAHNTFEDPHAVAPASYDWFRHDGDRLAIDVPAKSLLVVSLEL